MFVHGSAQHLPGKSEERVVYLLWARNHQQHTPYIHAICKVGKHGTTLCSGNVVDHLLEQDAMVRWEGLWRQVAERNRVKQHRLNIWMG